MAEDVWVTGTERLKTGLDSRCGASWEEQDEGEVHPRRPLPLAAWSRDSALPGQLQKNKDRH